MGRSSQVLGYPRVLALDDDDFEVEGVWLDNRPVTGPGEPFYGHGQILIADPDSGYTFLQGAAIADLPDPADAIWDVPGLIDDVVWWDDVEPTEH